MMNKPSKKLLLSGHTYAQFLDLNTLCLTVEDGGGAIQHQITLDPGAFVALLEILNTRIKPADPDDGNISGPDTGGPRP